MKQFRTLKSFLFYLLIIISSSLYSQEKDLILLKGIIVDKDGQPIPGVGIIERGTTHGTITNSEGHFELKITKGANVTASFVGMKSIEIKNNGFSNIKLNLEQGLIEFCCINHQVSHCAVTMTEMQKLSKKYNCSFK